MLTLAAAMSTGCVSQKTADDLQTLYRRSQEQVIDLKARLAECESRIKALQAQPPQQDPLLLQRLEQALRERDQLARALDEAKQALLDASKSAVLPPELDNDLLRLAESNPNLMSYDPKLGMLKFQSDMTFALGSTEVSAAAKQSLAILSGIMKKPVAGKYELRIVGHTDNVRIGRPDTKLHHPTNWHLSVHRSIAVKDALEQAGLEPFRMCVAGYGEYHPIAANGPKGNQANRRVEIYVVPSMYRLPAGEVPKPAEPAAEGAAAPAPAPAPRPAAVEPADTFK
ncbi:MAG: OmpA family protein [Phycisphaeraceae bacterium]|nr:OmpA family protein [Phycisphaeraceae bacterium]